MIKLTSKIYFKPNLIFAIFTTLGIALFCSLGTWQLQRAAVKEELLSSWQQATQTTATAIGNLQQINSSLLYKKITIKATASNDKSFLLDNKTYNGVAGYHVFTPITTITNNKLFLLVDRGWVPQGLRRSILPQINAIPDSTTISGTVVPPPAIPFTLDDNDLIETQSWPYRLQLVKIPQISTLLDMELVPFMLVLDAKTEYGYQFNYHQSQLTPERHLGYAVQWFSLAITLLILFLIMSCKKI